MVELNLYETNVLLFGEPSCFLGMVFLYIIMFLEVVFVGSYGLIMILWVLRRLS